MDDQELLSRVTALEIKESHRSEDIDDLRATIRELRATLEELKTWKNEMKAPLMIVGLFIISLVTAAGAAASHLIFRGQN